MAVDPEVTESKREHAYKQLRRLLVLQQIPEGQRLRETEWSARLGVNRSALREAFVLLEAEGLIVAGPKTGYYVPDLTVKDFEEIEQVRFVIEGAAIDIIVRAGRNTPEHLQSLVQTCDLFEQLISDEYHLSRVEADRRFHEKLVELSQNRRLIAAYRHAPLPLVHPESISGPQWTLSGQGALAEHREIIQALLAGDSERARKCLDEHLRGVHRPSGPRIRKEPQAEAGRADT